MKPLIDLFWIKYFQLQNAVLNGETFLIDLLDREIDPLLQAIHNERATTSTETKLQFQFVLDLLTRESDDSSNVMRHSKTLRHLAERYFAEQDDGAFALRSMTDSNGQPMLRQKGRVDEGFLNEAILDSLPDRVAVITPDYRYLYANALHAERLEEKPMALVGRHVVEFVGLVCFETVMKPKLDACFAGEKVDHTYSHDVTGRTIVMRSRMTPCRSSTGKVFGAILVLQEIADRRRAIAA